MSAISLTASMRSNLLSLQNIASRQDIVQNRLATGLKVSSAIDNPSSYYTATSLNNRAADLTALLDAMSQGVQTIKAATEGLSAAAGYLEQMRSVTERVLTEAELVPYQAEIEFDTDVDALLAEGYTAITADMSVAEIQAILDTDNAKVVLTEDVTLNSTITAHGKNIVINGGGHTFTMRGIYNYGSGATIENMKIVNTAAGTTSFARSVYDAGGNITVRNLDIVQDNTIGRATALQIWGSGRNVVENINVRMSGNAEQMSGVFVTGTCSISNMSVELSGKEDSYLAAVGSHSTNVTINKIGFTATGGKAFGVVGPVKGIESSVSGGTASRPSALYDGQSNTQAILDQLGADALAAYAASQFYAPGTDKDGTFGQGNWYLPSIGELMAMYGTDTSQMTSGYGTSGVTGSGKTVINDALKTLAAKGVDAAPLSSGYYWSSSECSSISSWVLYMGSGFRNYGNKGNGYYERCFQLVENCFYPFNSSGAVSGGAGGAAVPKVGDVMYEDKSFGSAADYDGSKKAVGVITEVLENGSVKIMNLKDLTFSSQTAVGNFDPDNPYGGDVNTTRWSTGSKMYQDITDIENFPDFKMVISLNPNTPVVTVEALNRTFGRPDAQSYQEQYNQVLHQYDSLISDSSYKGVNLLKGDSLKIRFNEDSSSSALVSGKDMSSSGISLSLADWAEKEGILQSVQELSAAVSALRSFSAELGNNYQIVTTREDFTENLINVLEEGADKLTLADMNQESANMLALQTAQQLAVNSLSLASQASQAVLKLF